MFLVTGGLRAETSDAFGFVRLVNVVSMSEGVIHLTLDEKDLAPNGYKTGHISRGVRLEAGVHGITARHPRIASGTTQLDIKAGQTLNVIVFTERVPSTKLGEPPAWRFRFLKMKQESVEVGNRLSFVSVSDQNEVKFQIQRGDSKAESFALERFSVSRLDLGEADGGIQVFDKRKLLIAVSPEAPSHSVVVIFDDAEGNLSAIVFDDSEFSIAG